MSSNNDSLYEVFEERGENDIVSKALELLDEKGDEILKKHSKKLLNEITNFKTSRSWVLTGIGILIGVLASLSISYFMLHRQYIEVRLEKLDKQHKQEIVHTKKTEAQELKIQELQKQVCKLKNKITK